MSEKVTYKNKSNLVQHACPLSYGRVKTPGMRESAREIEKRLSALITFATVEVHYGRFRVEGTDDDWADQYHVTVTDVFDDQYDGDSLWWCRFAMSPGDMRDMVAYACSAVDMFVSEECRRLKRVLGAIDDGLVKMRAAISLPEKGEEDE